MSSRSEAHREDRPVASISLSDANNKWNKLALALVEKYRSLDGRMPRHPLDVDLEETRLQDAGKGYEINITAENREWNKIALALLEKQKQALKHK